MTLLVLTDRCQARRPLLDVLAAAVAGGARRVLLRERDLPAGTRAGLAARIREILEPVGGRLLVAGPDRLDDRVDAVHLAVRDRAVPGWARLVGRSCHDADELSRAVDADYVTVSPVYPTATKPGYGPPLGIPGLRALVAGTGVPALALGGVCSAARAADCLAAGASGVAVMGAVMRAADPSRLVADLVREVGA